MRFYETLYIVHPALQAGRLKDIILDICKLIEDSGGKTLSNDIWGKKKLSYAIDKQKYGTYVLYQYNSNAEQVSSFNTKLDQNSNILGYLTSRIMESGVLESEDTIEGQIQRTMSKSDISKDVTKDTRANAQDVSASEESSADKDADTSADAQDVSASEESSADKDADTSADAQDVAASEESSDNEKSDSKSE